jgi:biopolymer transport protein TolR
MAMAAGSSGGPRSEINITPMVDVLLVLLIIFMYQVSTLMGQRGYDIEVPKESQDHTPPPADAPKNIMLSINEQDCNLTSPLNNSFSSWPPGNCRVLINDDPFSLSDLGQQLSTIYKAREKSQHILFLAAQNKINYEAVVRILDIAKTAVGEDLKIAIVSDERFAFAKGQMPGK